MTRALRTLAVVVIVAVFVVAEMVNADWERAKAVPVALCPHVRTVIHQPTPWEAERGRKSRTEHLPQPEGCDNGR